MLVVCSALECSCLVCIDAFLRVLMHHLGVAAYAWLRMHVKSSARGGQQGYCALEYGVLDRTHGPTAKQLQLCMDDGAGRLYVCFGQ